MYDCGGSIGGSTFSLRGSLVERRAVRLGIRFMRLESMLDIVD